MNLKLNNRMQGSQRLLELRKQESSIKEERRRTGRYIAILVGICLFLLAMYHAWVRRIPIVASLVVPALIMFIYVAWVLYTAARDKQRLLLLDAEAALHSEALELGAENEAQVSENEEQNIEIAVIVNNDSTKPVSIEDVPRELSEVIPKIEDRIKTVTETRLTMPIILINDKLPEDLDQKWIQVVQSLTNGDRFNVYHCRRKYKRKFCRKKHVVFKRSYSIA